MSTIESQLDANISDLVELINDIPAIHTVGSCGGHENPTPGQWPVGSWYIKLKIDRTDEGWEFLQFVAWLINDVLIKSIDRGHVVFLPVSPMPAMNGIEALQFAIEGEGIDPTEAYKILNDLLEKL